MKTWRLLNSARIIAVVALVFLAYLGAFMVLREPSTAPPSTLEMGKLEWSSIQQLIDDPAEFDRIRDKWELQEVHQTVNEATTISFLREPASPFYFLMIEDRLLAILVDVPNYTSSLQAHGMEVPASVASGLTVKEEKESGPRGNWQLDAEENGHVFYHYREYSNLRQNVKLQFVEGQLDFMIWGTGFDAESIWKILGRHGEVVTEKDVP